MDPNVEIERLLQERGAVLVRQGNHNVYKLPNGKMFTRAKTPSDVRSAHNSLRDLRHCLGIGNGIQVDPAPEPAIATAVTEALAPIVTPAGVAHDATHYTPISPPLAPRPPEKELYNMQYTSQIPPPAASTPSPGAAPPAPAQPETQAPPPKPPSDLKLRIEAAIRTKEGEQEDYMAKATAAESSCKVLKSLLQMADDPTAEETLLMLMAQLMPAPPARKTRAHGSYKRAAKQAPPPPPPPPVERITERMQVTTADIYRATQTFTAPFTTDDVLNLVTRGARLEEIERRRVRSALCDVMNGLLQKGHILKSDSVVRQTGTDSPRRIAVWTSVPAKPGMKVL